MKNLTNLLRDNKGITLVELLATLMIVSIIGALAYSVLFQGYSNYQRIQVETELRDEADFIMANLIKEVFLLKKNDIELETTCLMPDPNRNFNSSLKTFIKLKEGKEPVRPSNVSNSETYFIGFEQNKIKIGWNYLTLNNKNIKLKESSCEKKPATSIQVTDDNLSYTIKFSLETMKGNREHSMQFENTVQVINDEEGAN